MITITTDNRQEPDVKKKKNVFNTKFSTMHHLGWWTPVVWKDNGQVAKYKSTREGLAKTLTSR